MGTAPLVENGGKLRCCFWRMLRRRPASRVYLGLCVCCLPSGGPGGLCWELGVRSSGVRRGDVDRLGLWGCPMLLWLGENSRCRMRRSVLLLVLLLLLIIWVG